MKITRNKHKRKVTKGSAQSAKHGSVELDTVPTLGSLLTGPSSLLDPGTH